MADQEKDLRQEHERAHQPYGGTVNTIEDDTDNVLLDASAAKLDGGAGGLKLARDGHVCQTSPSLAYMDD